VASISEAAIGGAAGAVVTLAITQGLPLLWKAYKTRRIAPKKAHRQFCLDQAQWFYDRAEKLRGLCQLLAFDPPGDKFRLSLYLSKLDRHDQQWTMGITDLQVLANAASEKAIECEQNAHESERNAEEVDRKISFLLDPPQ
jgi:hypothetical protein